MCILEIRRYKQVKCGRELVFGVIDTLRYLTISTVVTNASYILVAKGVRMNIIFLGAILLFPPALSNKVR